MSYVTKTPYSELFVLQGTVPNPLNNEWVWSNNNIISTTGHPWKLHPRAPAIRFRTSAAENAAPCCSRNACHQAAVTSSCAWMPSSPRLPLYLARLGAIAVVFAVGSRVRPGDVPEEIAARLVPAPKSVVIAAATGASGGSALRFEFCPHGAFAAGPAAP